MNRFSNFIIKHKKIVITLFLLLALFGVLFSNLVTVNFKLADYLPRTAPSTTALNVMEGEFGGAMPNARVMINNISVREAIEYKEKLCAVDGIKSVSWLDDAVGLKMLMSTPHEFLDASISSSYYKDNTALFYIEIEKGRESETVNRIYGLIGEANSISGDAVNTAAAQEMSVSETIKAMLILIPVILLILIISTSSWVEPLLFLVTIGVAVLINMGTNVFFGEISFITKAVSPILQLAVSLDYAIFLMHSFSGYRQKHEPGEAMKLSVKKSMTAISASAATTVIGFFALIFMRFGIGYDLGINLVKGVLLSFISVIAFMPALTLVCCRLIDRTQHRRLIPGFKKAGGLLMKARIPFLLLALAIVVPCYLAQRNVNFTYGMNIYSEDSRAGIDAAKIEDKFGRENQLVLLVPKGDPGSETELCEALSDISNVTGIVSYAVSVGSQIPEEYLAEITDTFYSDSFARIIIYTDMAAEGAEAFETVKAVRDTAAQYYDIYHLAGQSASLYDMQDIVPADTKTVNLIAIAGILAVLLISFKSLSLPVLLLFTIETAIYINLSFAYFSQQAFNFIGFLVISTVQLGATIDYAILLTDRYISCRREMPDKTKKEAMSKALSTNISAVLISAVILSVSGFTLSATSTNTIIAQLGTLLFRGTALSFVMVVCVLPALLVLFDKVIIKTSLPQKGEK
jgi:predicted RND superfamily exporter protein